mmetsp:Transcript_8907/g.21477  ORF Transcript_8907/g.21477 Transcript_8907/m.21477 type:complete len:326 (+) Transcript_8907:385-1362(+)
MVTEVGQKCPASAGSKNDRLVKVRFASLLLRVDTHQSQSIPNLLQEAVEVELLVAGDGDAVWHPGDGLHLLHAANIDLVVHVDAPDILPVALDDVDQLVDIAVLAEEDLAVVDLVLLEDLHDHGLVDALQGHRRVEVDAARFLDLEVDVGRVLVQAYAHRLELSRQDLFMAGALGCVEDHEDEVGALCHGDDLPTAAFALGGALDDSRKVEQLDLGVVVVDDPGDASERRELVGRGLGLCPGELGQQRRLADGREANEGHAPVAKLLHVKPFAAARALGGGLELSPQLCELRLQLTQVILCRFVLLRSAHFELDLLDLFQNTHLV